MLEEPITSAVDYEARHLLLIEKKLFGADLLGNVKAHSRVKLLEGNEAEEKTREGSLLSKQPRGVPNRIGGENISGRLVARHLNASQVLATLIKNLG